MFAVERELHAIREDARATVRRWHLEEARKHPESGLARARSVVEEYALDPSAWPRLVSVRVHHGRPAALGFLTALGLPPEAIRAVLVALTDRAVGVARKR
ncbi:MAG: hypothetical protein M3Q03_06395 [Chloroflexota bacterium]|nr:hypothetical protein [Chloroflexota bacterium]